MIFPHKINSVLKGQCHARPWGDAEMDWTLTIDRTCVSHFSDQLFNCYKILTVCYSLLPISLRAAGQQCHPPPPFMSTTPASKVLHPPPPPTTCLTHPPLSPTCHGQCTHTAHLLCCCCSPHPIILSYCCSLHSIRMRTATTVQYLGAYCNSRTQQVADCNIRMSN